MATNDTLQIRYSDPITLYVYSGLDNLGDTNFGGYNIYVVKVPTGETPLLNSSGITIGRRLEHVRTIYPEVDVSYSGRINRIADNPIQRLTYSPQYIYPIDYYTSEENLDHYFYLSAFDKKGNVSSGLISHSNNPLRGPSIQSRAIQFANPNSTITIYNSGTLYPSNTANIYPSGTISFWITTPNSENTAASLEYGIIEKVNSNRLPSPFSVQIESTSANHPYIRFLVGIGGSSSAALSTTYTYWQSSTLEFNKKYHVVCTWSGASAFTISGAIYLNGVINTSSVNSLTGGMPSGPTGGANVKIGAVAAALDSWSGLILDGIHIYNRPLSYLNVAELYSGQIHGIPWSYDPNSLLTKFSFDEGSGLITYADYPVTSPEISGAFSGDIRWVRPLYIELRTDSFNNNVQQFISTYTTSGQINSGVITPENVSFQDRIFTNNTVKTQVEGLNNAGVVANNKVQAASIVDGAVTDIKLFDQAIISIDGSKFVDRLGGNPTVIGNSVIETSTIGDTLFENTKILYLQDANTVKQIDGTTKKLKYTSLSGIQEYRHIWSSVDSSLTAGAAVSYYKVTSTSGVIAYVPFIAATSDTLVRVGAQLKTSNASAPATISIGTCFPSCGIPVQIASCNETSNFSGVLGSGLLKGLVPGPSALALYLGANGIATVSGYYFTVEIGEH